MDHHALLVQLNELSQHPPQDDGLRRDLYQALRAAMLAIEAPIDTVRRVSFSPLQLPLAKVAINLDLFGILASHEQATSVIELARLTGVQDLLLRRILRYLASFGMISERGPDQFAASHITRALATPGFQSGIEHHFDVQLPCWTLLPEYLASTGYQNPRDAQNTAFQRAHSTDLPAFVWASQHPHLLRTFSQWMNAQRDGQPTWLDVFPLDQLTNTHDTSSVLLVDIGGGTGHQSILLYQRLLPLLPSTAQSPRIIVQDLPGVLSHAVPSGTGIEYMPHDFFTAQPIRHARFYYLRNILHDYPDERCAEILRRQVDAMGPDSELLIDEMVVPDSGAHWQVVEADVAMMAGLAAMERTRAQWEGLLRGLGLVVREEWRYDGVLGGSLLAVGRDEGDGTATGGGDI